MVTCRWVISLCVAGLASTVIMSWDDKVRDAYLLCVLAETMTKVREMDHVGDTGVWMATR